MTGRCEAVTNAAGEYSLAVPPGNLHRHLPWRRLCQHDRSLYACHRRARGRGADRSRRATPPRVSGRLSVTVTLSPKNVTLVRDDKSGETKPATVKVTVRITNSGPKAIDGVTQPEKLVVGYAPGITPQVPTVPDPARHGARFQRRRSVR